MKTGILAELVPRETSGADAQRAFDFQIHVSMARILELHAAGSSYFALFDHFDDLVLVEGDDANPIISFYQVKSRIDSAWTTARLAHRPRKGDLPKSIIGKAYYNIAQFGSLVRRASVLSNQPLHAYYATGAKVTPDDGEIILSTLCKAQHYELLKAITLDFPGKSASVQNDILSFERVPFDLLSFRDTVLGQVTSFVSGISPQTAAVAKPFYDALLSEVARCTGNKSKVTDIIGLKKRKGIDRKDLDGLIDKAQQRVQTIFEWWPLVQGELTASGMQALGQKRLYNKCLAYWLARQRGEFEVEQFGKNIRASIDANYSLISDSVLASAVALKLADEDLCAPEGQPYDLQAALIVELMEVVR